MSRRIEKVLAAAILLLVLCLIWQLEGDRIKELAVWGVKGIGTGTSAGSQIAAVEAEWKTLLPQGGLPRSYDQRETGRSPRIKDQQELGTCWAVATSSALESGLKPGADFNFSADHISMQNGYNGTQQDGGAYTMAMAYLAAWKGPVLEEEDPYGDGVTTYGLAPSGHVQEMRLYKEKNIEKMKKAIYQYGAVQSSIYMDMTSSLSNSVYYSQINFSYCYPTKEKPNHDVLIIGWDDDYPASDFIYNVSGNGAFICQNSWGEKFGDGGIFYVSYEDANIGANSVAYSRIESTDNYGKIYQSDECGWVAQLGYGDDTCYFANVYTAGENNEVLKAVGFYATDKDTSYTIYAIPEYKGELSLISFNPSAKGKFEDAGYYTVDLDEPVQLEAGKKFAVVVKAVTPGSEYPAAAECEADEMTQNVDLSDGEGYISHNGILWSSSEEEYSCNICLKAYTDTEKVSSFAEPVQDSVSDAAPD